MPWMTNVVRRPERLKLKRIALPEYIYIIADGSVYIYSGQWCLETTIFNITS